MRTDDGGFQIDKRTKARTSIFTFDMGRFGNTTGASQSGHERNRLFLNAQGHRGSEEFVDVSGVSGIDSPADGRAFAIWDYDRDGWVDVAVASANRPMLQIFRNRIPEAAPELARRNGFLALRFVGGNRGTRPSRKWSNRDGYGALVRIELDDFELEREHRCGEGLAAQNSATMLVGIGQHESARQIEVRWPSGRVQKIEDVPAGTLLTVHEDPQLSPSGSAFVPEPYAAGDAAPSVAAAAPEPARLSGLPGIGGDGPLAQLVLYSTMATTCEACHAEVPDLALLREAFAPEELAMFGVPVARYGGPDGTQDDPEALAEFQRERDPAYELLANLPRESLEAVQELVRERLDWDGYAASIVTDAEGRVLLLRLGAPSVSELRKLLGPAAAR